MCIRDSWREYEDKINMITTVVVGNSRSYLWGNRILTPRGYERKYSLDVNT